MGKMCIMVCPILLYNHIFTIWTYKNNDEKYNMDTILLYKMVLSNFKSV